MDPRLCRVRFENESVCVYPDGTLDTSTSLNMFSKGKLIGFGGPQYENSSSVSNHFQNGQPFPSHRFLNAAIPNSTLVTENDYIEDCDFSDAVLRYISQILMEEDMEDKTCMLQESLDLQAKEKSFYEVLGKKYPPSPEPTTVYVEQNDYFSGRQKKLISSCSNTSAYFVDLRRFNTSFHTNHTSQTTHCHPAYPSSNSSFSSSNNLIAGFLDSPNSPLLLSDMFNESQSIQQFNKGVEEAMKFLPHDSGLLANMDVNGLLLHGQTSDGKMKMEKKVGGEFLPTGLGVRKNCQSADVDIEEGSSRKQPAVFADSIVRSEEFDSVLLCNRRRGEATIQSNSETSQNGVSKNMRVPHYEQGKGSGGAKSNKKRNKKKDVIDLRTLLINSAQAVAADDPKNAYELLKQIRKHSSPFGDGNQRLAHCFADGLEARLAGTGSQIYKSLVSKRATAADYLKAYQLYIASCPFRKVSHFCANRTIRIKSQHAMRIHVIDFGILYGFQWPTFIQRISAREGGPPKLRITGIDFPQPGFRPAERIEETGRRLADYAESFNVPFEYSAIANKWDKIRIEDLNIDRDEFVVVNCLYRSKNLLDETLVVDSPRSRFLNLISKINPDIFIHGVVNGAYSAPFYVTRFREALFHFSSMFDMLDTIVSREHSERMLIEREIFRREAMNVIACEGWERVERPESYKQWHVRNQRAGLAPIPFDRQIMELAKQRVISRYHKDFVIDEDCHWLLQGWKGRIIYALSCWKPANNLGVKS